MNYRSIFCGIVALVCIVLSSGCSTARFESQAKPEVYIPLISEIQSIPCSSLSDEFKYACVIENKESDSE